MTTTPEVAIAEHAKTLPPGQTRAMLFFAVGTIQALRAQQRKPADVLAWAVEMFGEVARDPEERTMRFTEEALELAHAMGLHGDVVVMILQRVYRREMGSRGREIGQAQMTLEALAEVIGENSDARATEEWNRVRQIPREEWQRRHAAKQAIGIATTALTSALDEAAK